MLLASLTVLLASYVLLTLLCDVLATLSGWSKFLVGHRSPAN